jgi:hypothetical protein
VEVLTPGDDDRLGVRQHGGQGIAGEHVARQPERQAFNV